MALKTLVLSVLLAVSSAQLTTDCDQLIPNGCRRTNKALKSEIETSFANLTKLPAHWERVACAGKVEYGSDGIALTSTKKGDCTTIKTKDYIFFGSAEAKIKAALGNGMVSAFVIGSDVRDEIDWEWVGANGFRSQANFFGKGKAIYGRGSDHQTENIFTAWHTYKIDWTPEAIVWSIDGNPVRTLWAKEVTDRTYPQTPSRVSLGIWAGGDLDDKGTREWAGGIPDYSTPKSVWVKDIKIINYTPASGYNYTDTSGDFSSIKILNGTLLSNKKFVAPPPEIPPPPPAATAPAPGSPPPAAGGPPAPPASSPPLPGHDHSGAGYGPPAPPPPAASPAAPPPATGPGAAPPAGKPAVSQSQAASATSALATATASAKPKEPVKQLTNGAGSLMGSVTKVGISMAGLTSLFAFVL